MHRSRVYIAALLCATILAAPSASAYAATQSDANAHRDAAEEARRKAAAAQAEADKLLADAQALDSKIDALQADVDALDPQVGDAQARTARILADLDKLRSQVRATEAQIDVTTAEHDKQAELLGRRVTRTYKQGDLFYLDLLLESSDVLDLIARTTLVTRVIESNQATALQLSRTKTSLEDAKAKLERDLDAIAVKRAEAAAEQARLEGLQAKRQDKVDAQKDAQDSKMALMREEKANAAKLVAQAEAEEREAQQIEALLNGTGSSGSGTYLGTLKWPVPGHSQVTSPFGYRMHPILGYRKFHAGIDISDADDFGAPVVSVGNGTVIYASRRGGYGNCVMVDHGNGLVSLYAHLNSISVSTGTRVTAGRRVGTVGSTGLSTGPHLHFETRVNGKAVNPLNYRYPDRFN
ncbi:MAG: hypothetical protein FDZ70_10100 [Actinobacteria bacterium]|nr:MAG: hypothetical protein FDZ70_10100 [Actinomycetota bacterium]